MCRGHLVFLAVGSGGHGQGLAVEGAAQLVVDAHVPRGIVGGEAGHLGPILCFIVNILTEKMANF
jgi:hypothetical protein